MVYEKSKMKFLFGAACLLVTFGVHLCNPNSSDSSDERKPVHLASTCMSISPDKEKAPILLIHGIHSFKEIWMGLMPLLALKTKRRVCACDLRNHGDSPWSDEFDTDLTAKDIELLLETLKIEKVVLLGHSLGGKTAVHFTLNNPEKVERIIVEDMRPNGVPDEQANSTSIFDQIAEKALEVIPKGATEIEARRAVYNFFKDIMAAVNETYEMDDVVVNHFPIKCSEGKCSWKANLKVLSHFIANFRLHLKESNGKFDGPALFIYGERSPVRVPSVKEEISKLFPMARLVGVEDAGHNVNVFPIYKELVIDFINEKN